MPVEELYESGGHWIWLRDIGSQELLDATAGPASGSLLQQAFSTEPEHWFRIREDGKWVVKVVTALTDAQGEEEILDVSGRAQEGVTVLDGDEIAGCTKAYVEESKLVIEWQGSGPRGRVHLRNSKEVVSGMYHSTVEDLVRNVKGTRIFKRYPWYRIENKTTEQMTVRTYGIHDLLRLVPSVELEVDPGISYLDASAGDVEEEQAVFSLADGRECLTFLSAYGSATLDNASFKQNPYYTIENITGETVTLNTYLTTDFVCLIPAMTVEVPPGTSNITASAKDVYEEQAVFNMLDGRTYAGFNLQAFDKIVVSSDDFDTYPVYKIENRTGNTLTLTTYSTNDFMCLMPSMTVEVIPGASICQASSASVEEEQALFTLPDGRSYSDLIIKAFDVVVVEEQYFS